MDRNINKKWNNGGNNNRNRDRRRGGNRRGGRDGENNRYGGGGGRGGGRGQERNNFRKFVDEEKREQDAYWRRQNNQNNNYNRDDFNYGESFGGTSYMYNGGPTEVQHSLENHAEEPQQQIHNETAEKHDERLANETSKSKRWNNESHSQISARKNSLSSNVCGSSTPQQELAAAAPEQSKNPKLLANIKQEKKDKIQIKAEMKSPSSSSSNESSSSEDETPNTKASLETTMPAASTTLAMTLKTGNGTISNINATQKALPPSSSEASSSEDEETQPPAVKRVTPNKNISKDKSKQSKKSEKSKKKKHLLEDEVVCIGKLENKIVLEDDDDENQTDDDADEDEFNVSSKSSKSKKKKNAKKSDKKSVELCMLCDKLGHTSFQCQMICKNCSAPHHGFRTCPEPANLNTMLQLYMEFCMEQLQHFQPDKQFQRLLSNANKRDSSPKPLVGSPSTNKTGKRKQLLKTKENAKAKKRKVVTKKKPDEDDDDDDDSDDTTADSDEESSNSEDDDSSSEGSKKKPKAKRKNNLSTVPIFQMGNLMPNHPISYPMALNSLSNITAAPANPQLNTLLLTQMFQNAIGSLNKKQRS